MQLIYILDKRRPIEDPINFYNFTDNKCGEETQLNPGLVSMLVIFSE